MFMSLIFLILEMIFFLVSKEVIDFFPSPSAPPRVTNVVGVVVWHGITLNDFHTHFSRN